MMQTLFSYVVVALVVSACGIQKLAEETRDEVKHSNDQITLSNEEIKKSNQKQEEMIRLMGETIKQMNITNNGVHLQILVDSLRGLQAPENTENLVLPVRMMAFAETFAKEATADEILQIFHILYLDAQKGCPDVECNAAALTEEQLRLKGRNTSYTGAMLIASFTAKEKLDKILKEQVEVGGRYQDSALALASARYEGTAAFMLKSVLGSTLVSRDSLKFASAYFVSLKELAVRSYASKMKVDLPSLKKEEVTENDGTKRVVYNRHVHEVKTDNLWALGRASYNQMRVKLKSQLGEAVLEEPEVKALLAGFLAPAN